MTDDNTPHNNAICDNLHEELSFTVRAYAVTKGSLAFRTWFLNAFVPAMPAAAENFSLADSEMDGMQLIEVTAHNPFFNIDALESLWWAYKADNPAIEEVRAKLSVVKSEEPI